MIETNSRSRNVVSGSSRYIPPNAVADAPEPTDNVTAAGIANPTSAVTMTGVGRPGTARSTTRIAIAVRTAARSGEMILRSVAVTARPRPSRRRLGRHDAASVVVTGSSAVPAPPPDRSIRATQIRRPMTYRTG